MPALFRVEDTFAITLRGLFVLSGEVVEGTVRTGMLLQVPLNDAVTMTAPVHGVEFVDGPGQRSRIGLTLQYEDEADLAFWRGLNLQGHDFAVVEPADSPPPAGIPSARSRGASRGGSPGEDPAAAACRRVGTERARCGASTNLGGVLMRTVAAILVASLAGCGSAARGSGDEDHPEWEPLRLCVQNATVAYGNLVARAGIVRFDVLPGQEVCKRVAIAGASVPLRAVTTGGGSGGPRSYAADLLPGTSTCWVWRLSDSPASATNLMPCRDPRPAADTAQADSA